MLKIHSKHSCLELHITLPLLRTSNLNPLSQFLHCISTNKMHATTILTLFTGLATSIALPKPGPPSQAKFLESRAPKNQTGNSQIVLKCDGITVPIPGGAHGEGEGGFGSFSDHVLLNAKGQKVDPVGCTKTKSSFCTNCMFSGHGLSSPTNVTSCWNAVAGKKGCSIQFDYNGHKYDSQDKQDDCGHVNKLKPFQSGESAVCYFNI